MPEDINMNDTNAFNEGLDIFMRENGVSIEKFVDFSLSLDNDNPVALIEYIDGPTLKAKILQDAKENHPGSADIIWTQLNSYDDLLSIKFILEPACKFEVDTEKDNLIALIEEGKGFVFWFENELLKFSK